MPNWSTLTIAAVIFVLVCVFSTVIQISRGINGFDYTEQLNLIGR